MNIRLQALLIPTALALPLLAPSDAHAGRLDACGDVHVEANASCELVAEGCEVECTPFAVEAQCAAELYANCEGGCDLDASVECTADCRVGCEAQCEIDPGAFECAAACEADCGGSCAARCDSGDSECWASCEANCSAECSASCEVVPPSADCVAQCEGCCGGSCNAEINLDCQIECQADAYAECKVDLQGGCEADCSNAGAALFCDGQYIDHGNNLEACIDAIESLLDGEVSGEASLTCSGGECNFNSEGFLSCSVEGDRSSRRAGLGAAFVVFGLAFARRRRRRRQPAFSPLGETCRLRTPNALPVSGLER